MPAPKPSIGFIATLVLAVDIGPLLMRGLNAVSPLVIEDLGITPAQFGASAAVGFMRARLISAGGGRVADRLQGRHTMYLRWRLSLCCLRHLC